MRVLIVDDHSEVRRMLRIALGMNPAVEVVGEADSASSAVALATRLKPHTILLDLILPGAPSREVFKSVRSAAPSSRIVIYSARESSRAWYVGQGVQFFGKATDSVDALMACLREGADPDH